MRLAIPPILLAAVLGAVPAARAQAPAKPAPKPAPAVQGPAGQGSAGQGSAGQGPAGQGPVSAPVIGCPSLANYRLLRREATDEAAALARLGDARADHLGCSAFPRDRVAALADHVALGGTAYDCLTLQGTAICQWAQAGSVTLPAAAKPQAKPASADKPRR